MPEPNNKNVFRHEDITLDFRDVDLEKQPELKGIVDLAKNDTKAAADYVRKNFKLHPDNEIMLTRRQAYYELLKLRDTISEDYVKNKKPLYGFENICQIPIIKSILYEKDISLKEDWINSVNKITRYNHKLGKWVERYNENKKIMDEQLKKHWSSIWMILKRTENYVDNIVPFKK